MSETHSIFKQGLSVELLQKIEPVVESMHYKLCDVEVENHGATIRVFLESSEGLKNTIGIKDCEKVHRILGPLFDMWDPVQENYVLEVSSPGEKPPLRLLRHFQELIGEKVQFKTVEAIEMPPPCKARKNWRVILKDVSPEKGSIIVEDDYGEHEVPLQKIASAHWNRQWV